MKEEEGNSIIFWSPEFAEKVRLHQLPFDRTRQGSALSIIKAKEKRKNTIKFEYRGLGISSQKEKINMRRSIRGETRKKGGSKKGVG